MWPFGDKEILRGVDLTLRQGEVHALMGPNGSGKSTLSYALMGHPNYEVTAGSITLDGVDLLALEPDERAKAGIFLAFQYPTVIPGVSVANFLRHAVTNVRNPNRKEGEDLIPMRDFRKELREQMEELGVDQEFARRYLNDGFSGGEKKRAEILQLAMLRPAFAILDETDSGLDIDAVRIVSEGVNRVAARHETGVLVITHYERILTYIKPQFVHILFGGRIVENGGPELIKLLEKEGYNWVREKYPDAAKDEAEMEAAIAAKTAPGPRLRTFPGRRFPGSSRRIRLNFSEKGQAQMSTDLNLQVAGIKDDYKYGFHDSEENYAFKSGKGLTREIVCQISEMKNEPLWMREIRLKALEVFRSKPTPVWGGDLSQLNFDDIYYYMKAADRQGKTWDDVPAEIKNTFDKLGIPEAERKFLAGVGAQYESEVVYHSLREDLQKKGVIFVDTDTAVREYPDLVKQYFTTMIPIQDNKFAALNTAVWSGGSFVYIPKGVKVDVPLQAYFRINAENMGQFERTLIIVEDGAQVHYVEGCTAPMYSTESLHSAVVEIVVKKHGRCRYTTIQNWANNIYNLVTKRAVAYEDALMEWVDGNLGSRLTMKYPAVYMLGKGARGEILSIAFAGKGQHQDAGGKVVHGAPYTSSRIISKSISKNGGRASYRGLLKVAAGAKGSKSNVVCDALILDPRSRSDTYPYIEIDEDDVKIGHEASVSKIGEEQLFYLMSRGLSEAEASTLIVSGFIEPLVKELPMEYAVEMNKLIQLQMEGSVG